MKFPLLVLIISIGIKCSAQFNAYDEHLEQSTVALYKQAGEKYFFHGTGFYFRDTVIQSDYLVTCEHVLRNGYIAIRYSLIFSKFHL
ncbi:hypothetical protein CLV51_1136 [Chitinophaga niastensis]|uniref:Uncharacterized protein n=1 Tax=Chitinophaga niastensis TaxID=536980 RepID=A0A2P8H830_CHINA|nr:hypothetical protein CLV51_1136 [Chitinophaga niastensis]